MGRPRDASVEQRAHDAARQIYGEAGLGGLSFDAVARRSGVGKPALYRRWSSTHELLLSAIAQTAQDEGLVDTGSLRGDLKVFARTVLLVLVDDPGLASIRLWIDARNNPELFEHLSESSIGAAFRAARAIVPRAVARGEMAVGSSPTMLIELMVGAIVMRVLTGYVDAPEAPRLDDDYLDDLLGLCLEGARSR